MHEIHQNIYLYLFYAIYVNPLQTTETFQNNKSCNSVDLKQPIAWVSSNHNVVELYNVDYYYGHDVDEALLHQNIYLYTFHCQAVWPLLQFLFPAYKYRLDIYCRKGNHLRPESRQNLRQVCRSQSFSKLDDTMYASVQNQENKSTIMLPPN